MEKVNHFVSMVANFGKGLKFRGGEAASKNVL